MRTMDTAKFQYGILSIACRKAVRHKPDIFFLTQDPSESRFTSGHTVDRGSECFSQRHRKLSGAQHNVFRFWFSAIEQVLFDRVSDRQRAQECLYVKLFVGHSATYTRIADEVLNPFPAHQKNLYVLSAM